MTILTRSKYHVVSNADFRARDTNVYKLVYSTRNGTCTPLRKEYADALCTGALEKLPKEVIDGLEAREFIIPLEQAEDELSHILTLNEDASKDMSRRSFTILPTRYCNMGCEYCGQQHEKTRMPEAARDALTSRILRTLQDPDVKSVSVCWFGAEPMTAYPVIVSMSQPLVQAAQAADRDYTAKIVTNGSLLTRERIQSLYAQCRIRHIEITIDGPRQVHDLQRPLKNGRTSFDHIVSLLQDISQSDEFPGLTVGLRTNVTRSSAPYVEEYLQFMAERGLTGNQFVYSIHEVHNWGNDASAMSLQRHSFARDEIRWMELMAQLGMGFQILPKSARRVTCIATTRSAEVASPTGRVFSCSEHPLVPGFEERASLGTIESLSGHDARPDGEFDDWLDDVRSGESSPCGSCVFFPVCGGFCPKQWREGTVTCPGYKINIQDRLRLIAKTNGFVELS